METAAPVVAGRGGKKSAFWLLSHEPAMTNGPGKVGAVMLLDTWPSNINVNLEARRVGHKKISRG